MFYRNTTNGGEGERVGMKESEELEWRDGGMRGGGGCLEDKDTLKAKIGRVEVYCFQNEGDYWTGGRLTWFVTTQDLGLVGRVTNTEALLLTVSLCLIPLLRLEKYTGSVILSRCEGLCCL